MNRLRKRAARNALVQRASFKSGYLGHAAARDQNGDNRISHVHTSKREARAGTARHGRIRAIPQPQERGPCIRKPVSRFSGKSGLALDENGGSPSENPYPVRLYAERTAPRESQMSHFPGVGAAPPALFQFVTIAMRSTAFVPSRTL